MNDLPKQANGIRIGNVDPENKVRVYMVIDGKYTHWVEYDQDQLEGFLDVTEARLNEMKYIVRKALEGKDGP